MNEIMDVEWVSKRFGKTRVLADVGFVLQPGVTVLLGENGQAKSTLLRLLLGLWRADAGSLRVLGLDPLRDGRAPRLRVGYVPDQFDNPGWMTPAELFAFLAPQYPRWDTARARAAAGARGERRATAAGGDEKEVAA